MPGLQTAAGVSAFLLGRGCRIPSSAALGQIGERYVAEIKRWAGEQGIPNGARVGIRTLNLGIKSPLLCQVELHGRGRVDSTGSVPTHDGSAGSFEIST